MGDITRTLRFGDFTLDLANRQLWRAGEKVELGSRYFDALVLLAAHPHALISKYRFMEEVWRGIPVTDEALTQCIRTLRRALDDDASNPRFIETVPKHGYRFLPNVEAGGIPMQSLGEPDSPAARLAGATTLGALGAGVLGGAFYGIFGTTGSAAGIATIILLSAVLALLGGGGIGVGMAIAALWRGEKDWSVVVGGAAGGVVVGALGSAMAAHGMQSLTGVLPGRVTGIFEGLALGVAASASLVCVKRMDLSPVTAIGLAASIGALMTGLTALAGGSFLGATLAVLDAHFPASQLEMAGVGAMLEEPDFAMKSRVGTAICEGAMFAAAIVFANLRWRARQM